MTCVYLDIFAFNEYFLPSYGNQFQLTWLYIELMRLKSKIYTFQLYPIYRQVATQEKSQTQNSHDNIKLKFLYVDTTTMKANKIFYWVACGLAWQGASVMTPDPNSIFFQSSVIALLLFCIFQLSFDFEQGSLSTYVMYGDLAISVIVRIDVD